MINAVYVCHCVLVFSAEPVGNGSVAFIRFSTANLTTVEGIVNETNVTEMIALLELAQVVSKLEFTFAGF